MDIEVTVPPARSRIIRWTTPRGSSFRAGVDPHGAVLGATDARAVDFLRIATAVYIADRTSPRHERRWRREFVLGIPVSEPSAWEFVNPELCASLEFLTGDGWNIQFRRGAVNLRSQHSADGVAVHLFSGGTDSFIGAALAAHETGVNPVLVSHWDSAGVAGIQNNAARELRILTRMPSRRYARQIARGASKRENGRALEESTSRSRSIIFIAMGTVVAARTGGPMRIAENGFMSVNLPLGPERRGALTTRTTHPAFVYAIGSVLQRVGLNVRIENPLEDMTKGETFRALAKAYGKTRAIKALSATHSCGRPNSFREKGVNPLTHCGVCLPCLVRRAAFQAARMTDPTEYYEQRHRGAERVSLFARDRGADIRALRAAIARGVEVGDILALGLPLDRPMRSRLDLVQRGLRELAALPLLSDPATFPA